MANEENTPESWDFCRLNSGRWGIYPESAVNDGIDYFIATTRQVADPAREKDHARLIAAAPDLLAALKAMVEEQIDYCTINHLGDAREKHNVKWALSAIAKAGAA